MRYGLLNPERADANVKFDRSLASHGCLYLACMALPRVEREISSQDCARLTRYNYAEGKYIASVNRILGYDPTAIGREVY
jgi:hypothetical protein